MTARRLVVGAAAASLLLGCGVRSESSPRRVPATEVPFGLVAEGRHDAGAAASTPTATIYLVGPDGLVAARRGASGTVDAATAMRLLLRGPTDDEAAAGLTTALLARGVAHVEGRSGETVNVELSARFRDGSVPRQSTALAQIVLTATSVPGVADVRFTSDGVAVAVPRADGSLTDRPVDRADYVTTVAPG